MDAVKLLFPADNDVISFATQEQIQFHHDENRNVPHELVLEPRVIDLTFPKTVEFRWTPADSDGVVEIAPDPSFSSYETFPSTKGCASVYNLQHGKTFYCRVRINDQYSPVSSFSVRKDMPRWIYLPNVTNVRDMGLWKTQSGKQIKPGMLFRGAKLENLTSSEDKDLVQLGLQIFKEQLGIRTELDLRAVTEGINAIPMPEEYYYKFPMSAYATWKVHGVFTDDQKEYIHKIFDLFADANTYPIYFHCAGGGDRTGTIAFLLEAMLGLSDDDLITEYELSNLSVSGERSRFSEVWREFMKELETYAPAGTRQEQVISYLQSCGITETTLQKIADLLLEPAS